MALPMVILVLVLFRVAEMRSLEQQYGNKAWEHQEMLFSRLTNYSTASYSARLRPFATQNTPVKVNTSIYVYSMSSIDELRTDYTMQLLYRQTWFDDRLSFTPDATVQKIVGDEWHAQRIWTPTIHAVNDRDGGHFSSDSDLLHINPDGMVLLSKRIKLKPFCKMEFYRYPMDKQQCTLEIESSILPSSDMELSWAEEKPLDLNRNFLLTGFILTNYSLEESVATYRLTGNFSRITVRFDLQREFGHFLLDIYVPSILFVVTSWLSFWVEIPAAPARVTLSMTTMLTLVTSERAIREKLPKVSYVHALDIWNVVCTGFVFASLVEYALVNYIYHTDKRRKKNKGMKRAESTATFCSVDSDVGSTFRIFAKKGETHQNEGGMPPKKTMSLASLGDAQSVKSLDVNCGWPLEEFKMTPIDIANSIDRKCRFIFPAGFVVFNIIYWLVLWL
ncbi:glycine receptor subunit alpha-3-like [Uloborus diversus]|uniref:glycine receptor subunit alpha-3-like n=1 Tax=Uloborus diversus TaxID=327109 RepID=UPI002409C18B|nr:glycine receptor subunit alpha-3-like [Uloborus diversus]